MNTTDKVFRDKLRNHRIEPSERAWAQLSAQLDTQAARSAVVFYRRIAAGLAAILGAGTLWYVLSLPNNAPANDTAQHRTEKVVAPVIQPEIVPVAPQPAEAIVAVATSETKTYRKQPQNAQKRSAATWQPTHTAKSDVVRTLPTEPALPNAATPASIAVNLHGINVLRVKLPHVWEQPTAENMPTALLAPLQHATETLPTQPILAAIQPDEANSAVHKTQRPSALRRLWEKMKDGEDLCLNDIEVTTPKLPKLPRILRDDD